MLPTQVESLMHRFHQVKSNGTGEAAKQELLVAIRRHLHKNPEVGLNEFETSTLIREVLEEGGLEVKGPIAGTGLFVDIVGEHPGPIIAYRADIDALPIQDTKKVPYTSQNKGVAHLCGHDAHSSVAIGIALSLNERRDEIHGTIRVFFQPNEEGTPSGAPLMIKGGVLEKVTAAYAIHVDPTVKTGVFGLRSGPATAASDGFNVYIRGDRTGHSARPHLVIDTIWVAHQILSSLYQIIGRVTDSRNSAVLTVCRFHAGEANNVVPSETMFGGTLRVTDHKDRVKLRELMRHTVLRISDLYNARAEIEFNQGSPPVVNNTRLLRHIDGNARRVFGDDAVYEVPRPSMGAEDFAHYLDYVPGFLVRVGTFNGHPATGHPLHDSDFDIDESAIGYAVKLMTETLISHLTENPLDTD